MKFSIITPTYKRADTLIRAVSSVQSQTYQDWEMIIVNDSPDDKNYYKFTSSLNDARIQYHVNKVNRGVNYSRNKALASVSSDSKWVVFLDDDDYLAPDALMNFYNLILSNSDKKWFVTNRAFKDGKLITKFPKDDTPYSYILDYLLLKRCRGDVTHCIETKLITSMHVEFSNLVKQGEEWIFFYQLGLHQRMYYSSHNSTITDGYSTENGLNFRKRSFRNYFEDISILFYEGINRKIAWHPTFIIYLIIKALRTVVR